MPPQPPNQTVPRRRSRHAAGPDARTFGDGPFLGGGVVDGRGADPSSGRHRRPESLADQTQLRAVPLAPSRHRRSAEDRFELGDFEAGFIEHGFPEPNPAGPNSTRPNSTRPNSTRPNPTGQNPIEQDSGGPKLPRQRTARKAEQPAERAHWVAESDRRRAQREKAAHHRPGSAGRGKHAAPPAPVVTVRALPVVRDAVVDGLPAAKRAADAVREWALYTGDRPPATGSHRAPGTLPIESWLLIGRGRQQALLATLVAAGLALVMIPIQRHESVNPINAADRSTVGTSIAQKAKTTSPAGKPGRPNSNGTPAKPAAQPVPAQNTGPKPAPPAPADIEPAIAVPPGTGPAQSLKVTGSKDVALTFDDGPDPVQTPKILALLAKYQVKATFCLVGRQVQKHPEIVRQIVAAGHTLCNHTWSHSLTIGKDKPAQIRADLEKTNAAIRAAVPDAEIPFFRAPGGNFTDRLVSVAYGEKMTSLYWQVDPSDWDHSTDADDAAHTDRVIANVQKYVQPGSIILSHDFNQPDTIVAYETLLPWLTGKFATGLPVPPAMPADSPPPASAPDPSSASAPASVADPDSSASAES